MTVTTVLEEQTAGLHNTAETAARAAVVARTHAERLAKTVADLTRRGELTAELERAAAAAAVAALVNGEELPAQRLAELAAQRAALALVLTTARAQLPAAQRAALLAEADAHEARGYALLAEAETRRNVTEAALKEAMNSGGHVAALARVAQQGDELTGAGYELRNQAAALRREADRIKLTPSA